MNICECCGVKLEAFIIVTVWGLFCSQECANSERDFVQRSEDRDYDYNFINLGE